LSRAIPVAFAAVAVAALLSAATGTPEIYRNEEFGITLSVSKELLLCPTPNDEHDHGPVLLLGTSEVKGCSDLQLSRYVDVFASFNKIEDTKTLAKFLKSQCTGAFKGKCLPAPPRLGIDGMRSAAARVNHSDGWIDILVVTQAGKPDPLFDASIPSINYDLHLHTRPEHLEKDLHVFRSVLETIRLSPVP
jgi:hypothetical protein